MNLVKESHRAQHTGHHFLLSWHLQTLERNCLTPAAGATFEGLMPSLPGNPQHKYYDKNISKYRPNTSHLLALSTYFKL